METVGRVSRAHPGLVDNRLEVPVAWRPHLRLVCEMWAVSVGAIPLNLWMDANSG